MGLHGMVLLLTIDFSVISAANSAVHHHCDPHAKNDHFMGPEAAAIGPGGLVQQLGHNRPKSRKALKKEKFWLSKTLAHLCQTQVRKGF